MQVRNTESRYGSISKLLHWGIVLLVIEQLYSALWTIWVLPLHSPLASFYIDDLHKPIGILIFGIVILAVLWKLNNIRPSFPRQMARWEIGSARIVHTFLYLGLLALPISGIIMSTAAGYPPNFFGLYKFPMFIAENKAMAQFAFDFHKITSYVVIGLIVIHTLAALKHHFIDKDNVLKRMLWGR